MDAQRMVVVLLSNVLPAPVSSATVEPAVIHPTAYIHLEYKPTTKPVNVVHFLIAQTERVYFVMPPTKCAVVRRVKSKIR
tara:strand:- start:218 stop:457 length:240 start_codon:yes stop_codon:yes gene_type:complete